MYNKSQNFGHFLRGLRYTLFCQSTLRSASDLNCYTPPNLERSTDTQVHSMHTRTRAHTHTHTQTHTYTHIYTSVFLLRATRRFLGILCRFSGVIQQRTNALQGTLCRASVTSKILGRTLCRFVPLAGHLETRVRAPASSLFCPFAIAPL